MEDDTGGDPVRGCKWTHKTTENVAEALESAGIQVSANTVARLLKQMDYSLRVNLKNLESGLSKPQDPHERDEQFRYIFRQKKAYAAQERPVISVDTKSRELVGKFRQAGRRWSRQPIEVFDHDFPSDAEGVAIPYGIYDPYRNHGFVNVGTTRDTPQFAVDSISAWWTQIGTKQYAGADHLLILADCGGSNGYRARLWKYQLQAALCDRFGLHVKICHFPPGSSKWNPIEHRLFAPISNNWAAQPLVDHDTVLNFIRHTRTSTGLRVCARLSQKDYPTGIKISDEQMQQINLRRHTSRSQWNYSISPS